MLTKTWIEKKIWNKVKDRLQKGYVWKLQEAGKRNRKEKAMEEMVMGIRKKLIEKDSEISTERERVMVRRIKKRDEKWRIIGVYARRGKLWRILGELENGAEERKKGVWTIVGGILTRRQGQRVGVGQGKRRA